MESVRFLWKALDFYGKRYIFMESIRFLWKALDFYGKYGKH